MIVLDAGALIAIIKFEPGASKVRRLLRVHKGGCFIHSVNLLEVCYGFERAKGRKFVERSLEIIEQAGVEVRSDFDRQFLLDASHLKANNKLSTADSIGLALARRLGVPFVSSDRHELSAIDQAGLCQIIFIR